MTSRAKKTTYRDWLLAVVAGLFIGTVGGAGADVDVSQSPLYVGSDVPGNLAFVPSVEFPTVISKANLSDTYSVTSRFVGYFDSEKCYRYHYSDTESDRYFYPVSLLGNNPSSYACTGAGVWAGNFLNWAATQTIDPFRSALTGGYRSRDTASETLLEKAVADRPATSNFPRRSISNNATLIAGGGGCAVAEFQYAHRRAGQPDVLCQRKPGRSLLESANRLRSEQACPEWQLSQAGRFSV